MFISDVFFVVVVVGFLLLLLFFVLFFIYFSCIFLNVIFRKRPPSVASGITPGQQHPIHVCDYSRMSTDEWDFWIYLIWGCSCRTNILL